MGNSPAPNLHVNDNKIIFLSKYTLLIASFLLPVCCCAQTSTADSIRLAYYFQQANNFMFENRAETLKWLDSAAQICQKHNLPASFIDYTALRIESASIVDDMPATTAGV